MAVSWREAPHYVYECKSPDGVVYIGCTGNPTQRLRGLRREAWWTADTEMLVVAAFARRLTAYAYESKLIREQRPRFNRKSNPDTGYALAGDSSHDEQAASS